MHDGDAITQGEGFLSIMRDEDAGDACAALHLLGFFAQTFTQQAIKIGEGFIEHEQARIKGERTSEGDALLLSARELRGTTITLAGREAYPIKHLVGLGESCCFCNALHAQTEGDILQGAEMREQRVVLKHHACVPPLGRIVGHIAIMDNDATRIGRQVATDETQQRALAAAGGTEQTKQFTGGKLERDIVHSSSAVGE